MRIQFMGAAQMVTGSKHLITTRGDTTFLLDCGLCQGGGRDVDDLNRNFGFDPSHLDFVILSHAHIDHSGLLPKLVKNGFNGKIYATPATISLCEIMLMDSAHIQESDLKYVNKRRRSRGQTPLEPLYDSEDAQRALNMFEPISMHVHTQISKDVSVYFTDTGHIIGSVAVNLTIQEGEDIKKLTFTGDIGRPGDKILRSPEAFEQADYIISESTYGDRLHAPLQDIEAKLLNIVRKTCVEQKGKLIIPAFSVDRTQELVYALDRLEHEGKLPKIKVYVDSPLSVKATHIMNKHRECFNPEILEYITRDGDPFGFPNLIYNLDAQKSKAINDEKEPSIIISASGMAEAGRIKHHIKNNIGNPNSTVLLVGYATPHSLAGRLKNGYDSVRIFGEEYPVKCGVEVMDNFSAHADYNEMIDYLKCQDPSKVKNLFLVHGEIDTQQAFAERLENEGFRNIEIPEIGDEFYV